ncbi:MAG: hypothetical protein ABI388_09365 [Bacteroidia bacterium]
MKIKLILALLVITQFSYGQNIFTKSIAKLAKMTGKGNDVLSANLEEVSPVLVIVSSNLTPKELGTISQTFFNGWISGGDAVFFAFTKKNEAKYVKIDGTVMVDGQPAEYITSGMYAAFSSPNSAARKVEITTSTGQKSSFMIEPSKKHLKVLSVNGQTDKIELDLSKDVEVQLDDAELPDNSLLKVSLAINQMSIKSIYDVCYIRKGSKIIIPAAAFRNINIKPAGKAIYGYKKSFLTVGVESEAKATSLSGPFGIVDYKNTYEDGKFVSISKEPELNLGLTAKAKEELKDGEMNYDFFKPGAFTSRSIQQLKKIGLYNFTIEGQTLSEASVITQEENKAKNESQTTKLTTVTFPPQTNEVWNEVLAKIYPQICAVIQSELKATILPPDAVVQTTSYKSLSRLAKENTNSNKEFISGFGGSKTLSSILPLTEGLGSNSTLEKIMNEVGVDALLNLTLSFSAQRDGDFGVLTPKLTFELIGKANNLAAGTTYYSGTITGKGVPSEHIGLKVEYFSANGLDNTGRNDAKVYHTAGTINAEELEKIVRRADFVTVLAKALKDIKSKELANTDYETAWNLQK